MSSRQDITRPLPNAHDMEQGVLSCMMQAPEYAVERALKILQPSHFHVPANRLLFEILTELHRECLPIDPVTIQQLLMDRKMMDSVGGPAAVAEIYILAPTPSHVSHYAKQIKDKSTLRKIIEACSASMEEAFDRQHESADETLAKAEARILAVREAEQKGDRTLSGTEAVFRTLDAIEHQMTHGIPMGTPSGIPTLDTMTGGIPPGLILIGGETSGGKSVIAMLWTLALLRAGKRTKFYSMEMPTDACMRRMLCHLSGVPLMRLMNPIPEFKDWEHAALMKAAKEFSTFGHLLTICDDHDLTASTIRAECRREHASVPLGAVVVDYIQKLTPEDPRAIAEQQISASSAALKKLADDIGIPVITPVQLNADNATRGSKSLSQDCDMFVRIVHQKDKDGAPAEPDEKGRRECGLWVEKVRQGPRWFMIQCQLDGARMNFEETH